MARRIRSRDAPVGSPSHRASAPRSTAGRAALAESSGADTEPSCSSPFGVDKPLVLVSLESGSQRGARLAHALRRCAAADVWELPGDARGGLEAAAKHAAMTGTTRVVVAGGDGTASAAFAAFEAAWPASRPPPVYAVLPCGTGNDLARETGWKQSGVARTALRYRSDDALRSLLAAVCAAPASRHDRWALASLPPSSENGTSHSQPIPVPAPPPRVPFSNYASFGFCASVSLAFARLRSVAPRALFSFRLANKLIYGLLGAILFLRSVVVASPLRGAVLTADGRRVDIPRFAQGLVFLNIGSFMGGVRPWPRSATPLAGAAHGGGGGNGGGERNGEQRSASGGSGGGDASASPSDGRLEVCAHFGALHLVTMQLGLAAAVPLAVASRASLHLSPTVAACAAQADGEPWVAPRGAAIEVSHAGAVALAHAP